MHGLGVGRRKVQYGQPPETQTNTPIRLGIDVYNFHPLVIRPAMRKSLDSQVQSTADFGRTFPDYAKNSTHRIVMSRRSTLCFAEGSNFHFLKHLIQTFLQGA